MPRKRRRFMSRISQNGSHGCGMIRGPKCQRTNRSFLPKSGIHSNHPPDVTSSQSERFAVISLQSGRISLAIVGKALLGNDMTRVYSEKARLGLGSRIKCNSPLKWSACLESSIHPASNECPLSASHHGRLLRYGCTHILVYSARSSEDWNLGSSRSRARGAMEGRCHSVPSRRPVAR